MIKMLSTILVIALCASSVSVCKKDTMAAEKEPPAAYLATFVAEYEYNMGVEHAQFPSGNYTNNRRTDTLYYAISTDGVTFTGLNNDRPVLYPYNMTKLGSPSLFRKADGTYGLIAGIDNDSNQIFLSDSDDLITFYNDRTVALNSKGIKVNNPVAEFDEKEGAYNINWEGGDGNSYVSVTKDFTSFSEPVQCDYRKKGVEGELPVYAKQDEADIFELNAEEYQRLIKKYGEIKSVSVDGLFMDVTAGSSVNLPETLNVRYSDDSVAKMGVTWDTEGTGLDFDKAAVGTYKINGTIIGTTEYNSPVADFRADPFILYNESDGYYYLTGSYMQEDLKNAYDYVVIRRAKTINELTDAEEVRIFSGTTKAESGVSVTPDYWAPEIHMIDGKYRILVQGTVDGASRQCILTCDGDNLMDPDAWSYTGYIGNTTDNQPIGPFDTTYFEYDGQGYYVTQHTSGGSKLDITTVNPSDPTTPTGPRVSIAVPDRAYENNIGTGQSILEGPAALIYDGRVYVTYSGATIDMHYCTNLVYADLDSDLMAPESWTKLQTPLFTTTDVTTTIKDSVLIDGNGEYEGLMGPGHSNFTVDENGNVLLVYHARDWSEHYADGNNKYGLSDPGRHAYVKCVHFGADGFPILNMTSEQILSNELRDVTMTINVTDSSVPVKDPVNQNNGTVQTPVNNPKTVSAVPEVKVYTVSGIKYSITSKASDKAGTVTLIGAVNKKIKSVNVKNSIKINKKTYKVTQIAAGAFKNCGKLKKVTIGSNVTKIGKKAFYGCSSLKKVIIKSKRLKKVGKDALKKVNPSIRITVPKTKASVYKKLIKKGV